jgi:chromatin segregation and condensation protein Rec8/ScpA/Scc1 (kleisin family)
MWWGFSGHGCDPYPYQIKASFTGKEEDGEVEEPREEITRPLLEYLQFKELADDLAEGRCLRWDVFQRRPDKDYPLILNLRMPRLRSIFPAYGCL